MSSIFSRAFLKAIFISGFLLFSSILSASNYYWVGGAGDWSDFANHWATTSGGNVYHVQEPTPFDNVYFDVNSFSSSGQDVSITATIFTCNNMDWSGVTNHPVFSGSASTGQLEIYGSLKLDTGMAWAHYSLIHFKATSPGKTVMTAGHQLNDILMDGIGGSWTLQDSLKVHTFQIGAGTFYSNNQLMRVSSFSLSSTCYLGTSVITNNSYWSASPANFIDADSTTILCQSSSSFMGGNRPYHIVDFSGASSANLSNNNLFDKVTGPIGNFTISGNNSFDTLYSNNPGQTIVLQAGATQTIVDTISINGSCAGLTTINSSYPGIAATISKASGNVTLNYLLMRDITGSGGATFSANNSTVISNVIGWTIPIVPVQNLYWVGGAGNWDDPSHWSTTSGGTGGSCLPTLNDNVFFDVNSFSTSGEDVTINVSTAYCVNMDWSGASHHPNLNDGSNTIEIHGSLTMTDSMTVTGGDFDFESNLPGTTITTGNNQLYTATINGSGTFLLMDSLKIFSLYTTGGTFYSNNKPILSSTINLGSTCYLGTSIISRTTYWTASASSTIDVDSTTINCISTTNFLGGNHTYHNVNFDILGTSILSGNNSFDKVEGPGLSFRINGNNNFDTLICNNPGQSIELESGSTQTIMDTIVANGSCAGLTTLHSTIPSLQATISKASGNVTMDYLLMQDINATGGANFTANNSVVVSNVTGWTVPAVSVQNLYWVGGAGNWNDPAHWSTTSGGFGGSCLPTQFDNVFFDANSFSSSGDDVSINVATAYCMNMDWTGANLNPNLQNIGNTIEIHGSLTLADTMTYSGSGHFDFQSTIPGNTITTWAHQLFNIDINGSGTFTLQDSLNAIGLYVANGTFNSNDQAISAMTINLGSTSNMGTSIINNVSTWTASPSATVDLDSTTINFFASANLTGGNHIYHDVNFTATSNANLSNSNQFDKVLGPTGNFTITGANSFDTLYFNNPGQTVTLEAGNTQTINNSLQANATGGFPISLISNSPGIQANISMPLGDTACLNYIYMQDQNATGGGIFYAGIYSSNISNNTGWQFSSCIQPISDVWPGDANYDLTADNLDILNIGIAFNQNGFVRPGATTNYVAQPCLDWPSQFITGVNTKHADTDGNGIVNMIDTIAVSLNYGITHPPRLSAPDSIASTAPDLYFQFPSGPYVAGSWITVEVDLGTIPTPALNAYGLALTLNYPSTMIVPNTMSASYNGSWLVTSGNNIHLEKNFFTSNKIDFGFSRISHTNISGNGKVVSITFQLANSASGPFQLSFSNVLLDDNLGNAIPVNAISSGITIGINENPAFNSISIYPNPSNGMITVNLGEERIAANSSIEVCDLTGRVALVIPAENKQLITLDLDAIPNGVYFIRLDLADGNKVRKKIVKQ